MHYTTGVDLLRTDCVGIVLTVARSALKELTYAKQVACPVGNLATGSCLALHSGLAAMQDAYDSYLPAWQPKEIGNTSTCGS